MTTTTTAITPVMAPALKIPTIASQLLSVAINKNNRGMLNFFIGLNI